MSIIYTRDNPDLATSFRDRIPTTDHRGKRVWIYPTKPSGRFFRARAIVSAILLLLMVAGPWLTLNGNPLLQFNIPERRFYIFGLLFLPMDFYILAIALISLLVGIVAFTAVFGRVWCGWLCPQTVMMEMVYRRIEYLIEGDGPMQRLLNLAPWTAGKVFKKTLKHGLFALISIAMAHLLLAYVIGPQGIAAFWRAPSTGGLVALFTFSLVFYGIFARFREQACTFVCPYGRFQSVLLDENSLVVAYDHKRGEGRAKFNPKLTLEDRHAKGLGDCVDCNRCVAVCPTGIDIRNGTPQMECVNCTACIDACDGMMDNLNLPRGLVRFASRANIETGTPFKFTRRLRAYGVLLCLLISLLVTLIVLRPSVDVFMVRVQGTTFQTTPDGTFTNIYTLKLFNKTPRPMTVELVLVSPAGAVVDGPTRLTLPPLEFTLSSLVLHSPREGVSAARTPVRIRVVSEGKTVRNVRSSFLAPPSGGPL